MSKNEIHNKYALAKAIIEISDTYGSDVANEILYKFEECESDDDIQCVLINWGSDEIFNEWGEFEFTKRMVDICVTLASYDVITRYTISYANWSACCVIDFE